MNTIINHYSLEITPSFSGNFFLAIQKVPVSVPSVAEMGNIFDGKT